MTLARLATPALVIALAFLAAPPASAGQGPEVDVTFAEGPRCEDYLSEHACAAIRHCLLSDPLCDEVARLLSTNCNDLLAQNLCNAFNDTCDGILAESICDRIADPPALPGTLPFAGVDSGPAQPAVPAMAGSPAGSLPSL